MIGWLRRSTPWGRPLPRYHTVDYQGLVASTFPGLRDHIRILKLIAWGKLTFGETTGEMAAEVDTLGQAAAQVLPALLNAMLSQLFHLLGCSVPQLFEPC